MITEPLDLEPIRDRANAATEGPWATARTDVSDLLDEVQRQREQLALPCGSCHPCANWADETWRRANRKPPAVITWDNAQVELKSLRADLKQTSATLIREEHAHAEVEDELNRLHTAITQCAAGYEQIDGGTEQVRVYAADVAAKIRAVVIPPAALA